LRVRVPKVRSTWARIGTSARFLKRCQTVRGRASGLSHKNSSVLGRVRPLHRTASAGATPVSGFFTPKGAARLILTFLVSGFFTPKGAARLIHAFLVSVFFTPRTRPTRPSRPSR
jgi:hypothetical protein